MSPPHNCIVPPLPPSPTVPHSAPLCPPSPETLYCPPPPETPRPPLHIEGLGEVCGVGVMGGGRTVWGWGFGGVEEAVMGFGVMGRLGGAVWGWEFGGLWGWGDRMGLEGGCGLWGGRGGGQNGGGGFQGAL